MIDLLTAIYEQLDTSLTADIYYEKIKKDSKVEYPYVVYNLVSSIDRNDSETYIIEVDIWDNEDDTTQLEILTKACKESLDHYSFVDSNIGIHTYLINVLNLPDQDENIRRRQLRFEVKTFFYN